MKYIDFYEKISYSSKKEALIFLLIGTILGLLTRYCNIEGTLILKNVFDIIPLLAVIILFLSLNHVKNIRNEKVCNAVSFLLVMRILIYIVSLSYDNQYRFIKEIFVYLDSFDSSNIQLINLTIVYYLIVGALYKKKSIEENLYGVFIKAMLFLYIPFVMGINFGEFFYFINYLQIIYLSIKLLKEIINNEEVKRNKINLIKMNIINILIYSTSRLINLVFSIKSLVIELNFITNIVYFSYIIFVIYQIIKENYNFAFVETIEANKKLEEINKEIKRSNIRLEKAYEKINNRKNLYKEYLDGYGQPIILLNENFRIQYCNNRFLSLFNEKDIKGIINRRIETFINFNFSIYEKILMEERFIMAIDILNKKYEVEFINLIEEDIGIMLSFKDLTEELKIIEMKQELESIKERELIKNNFLSNISHDIKAPINVIYSEIQLEKILIENKDKEKLEEYNEISKQNCLNLTKLTNNIIDISKIDSENLEPNLERGNIVEFIEGYIDNLSNYIKSNGLEVIFDTEEEDLEIEFDEEMMRRILINLISNSIKYTKNNGVITINILNEEKYIIIEFKDNGIGMSEEFLKKAFDKYAMERSEEGDSKGFGIGLYVVFNLVKAQNGEIKVSSILGKESKFEIKFYK